MFPAVGGEGEGTGGKTHTKEQGPVQHQTSH